MNKENKCGCGRSPTGKCIGWHALSEEIFAIKSKAIHGNKTQNNRMKALDDFKNNRIKILVATDVAARGLDINFDIKNIWT